MIFLKTGHSVIVDRKSGVGWYGRPRVGDGRIVLLDNDPVYPQETRHVLCSFQF